MKLLGYDINRLIKISCEMFHDQETSLIVNTETGQVNIKPSTYETDSQEYKLITISKCDKTNLIVEDIKAEKDNLYKGDIRRKVINEIDDAIDYLTEIERIVRLYVMNQTFMVTYDTDFWIKVIDKVEDDVINNGYYDDWQKSYEWYIDYLIRLINNYIKYSSNDKANRQMQKVKQLILNEQYEQAYIEAEKMETEQ